MFHSLDTWLNTLLTILVVIGGILLLLLILDLIFVGSFKTILKRHNKTMNVILMAKYDNIKTVMSVLDKLQFQVDPKMTSTLSAIDPKTFVEQDTPECKKAREDLTYLRSEIFYICRKNPSLEKDEEFVIAKNNILEMDTVYRSTVAMYNADALGYNYWIRFMPFRWVFLLFKVKQKELI